MVKFDQDTKMWMASVCRRCPQTNQPVSRRRLQLASKAEAVKVEGLLNALLEKKFKELRIPNWPQFYEEFSNEIQRRHISPHYKDSILKCLNKAVGDDWNHSPNLQTLHRLSDAFSVSLVEIFKDC